MASREIRIRPGETVTIVCESETPVPEEINKSKTTISESGQIGGKKSRKTRKNVKNQSGGKTNGYMKFVAKMRPQIIKENPEMKSDVVAVARKLGEKWRSMSDDEKSKF